MPVLTLNRERTWLMPPTLDELIPEDHPARFVAAFVDGLEGSIWAEMEVKLDGDPLGAPSYHPRAMLGIWLYGFMTGTRSTRKLEAACRDQMPYLWLSGWQRPDHNSLWRFYKAHRSYMRKLFKRTVRTALNIGLVDMAMQAVDGTKVAANASKKRTYTLDQLHELEGKTEKAIEALEAENEAGLDPPPAHLPKKLADKARLLAQVRSAMDVLAKEEKERINLTDGDASLLKTSQQNRIAGYNMEAMVSPVKSPEREDVTGRIITAVDVTNEQNDVKALVPMMEQAEEVMEKRAEVTLADANFHSGANLKDCAERKQTIVMSEPRVKDLEKPYHKDRFIYDANSDSYTCPQGQTVKFLRLGKYRDTPVRVYSMGTAAICRRCPAFGECTKDRGNGRRLEIGPYDIFLRRHREWMATREAKDLYRKRKVLPEPVFGIIKEQMSGRRFLLRGIANVRAEATLLATAFNLRTLCKVWRMGLPGVTRLVSALNQGDGWVYSPAR